MPQQDWFSKNAPATKPVPASAQTNQDWFAAQAPTEQAQQQTPTDRPGFWSGVYETTLGPLISLAKSIAGEGPEVAVPKAAWGLARNLRGLVLNPLNPQGAVEPLANEDVQTGNVAHLAGQATGLAAGMLAPKAIPLAGRTLRAGAQEALGVGPKLTEKAVAARNADIADAQAAYKEKLNTLTRDRAETTVDNDLKWADTQNKYNDAVQARQQLIDQQTQQVAQRQALEQKTASDSLAHAETVKAAEKNIRATLGKEFQDIGAQVGQEPVNFDVIQKAVKNAQTNILKGSPESIAIFKNILREGPQVEDATVFRSGMRNDVADMMQSDQYNIAPNLRNQLADILDKEGEQFGAGTGRLTFDQARGYYSELGGKMYEGRELPGDVYKALEHVRTALDNELQRVATEGGVGPKYADAKYAWSEFEKNFHDMRSVAQGGSPLARIVRAVDPAYAIAPLLGKAQARLLNSLEQYKGFGTNPALAKQIISDADTIKGLPSKVKEPPEVKPPVRKDKALATLPTEPAPVPPVDIAKTKAEMLDTRAEAMAKPSFWQDFAVPAAGMAGQSHYGLPAALAVAWPVLRRLAARAIESKSVQRTLTTPRPADIRATFKSR